MTLTVRDLEKFRAQLSPEYEDLLKKYSQMTNDQ